jgi:putative ABC transport system permease protein
LAAEAPRARGQGRANGWAIAFSLARRELRGGIRGFRIFLMCLMLGVAIIAAVGSLSAAVVAGIAADARAILGGDLDVRIIHREATDEQRAALAAVGAVSETREMRAMARPAVGDSANRVLVELKAVDGAYPLYGAARLTPALPLADALARRDGVWGAVADPALLQRLDLAIGDRVRIGTLDYELRAALDFEPDHSGGVFVLGPRFMVAQASLAETGLVQPGSLIYSHYRLRLSPGTDAVAVAARLNADHPDAGWRIRGLDEAAPGVKRFVSRMSLFLTLVGLSALLVGGVGVGNAVRAYLDGKTATIAVLKCLGAPAALVTRTYLTLVVILALGGIAVGLLLGGLVPAALAGMLAERFDLSVRPGIYLLPLAEAAAFGLLTAVGFSLWPLARARTVPAASLFRNLVAPVSRLPRRGDLLAILAVGILLAGFTIVTAPDRGIAAGFVAGAIVALVVFRGVAQLVMAAARRLSARAGSHPGLRLALANLHRPGAATASVVLSLGLGLTVLVAVVLIQGNLGREIQETLPDAAPSFFFIDIQPDQAAEFDQLVEAQAGATDLERVPMLRGRITAVDGVPADQVTPSPGSAWVLQGDRGITWSATQPRGSRLVAGEWWPADYAGPPLVSMDAEAAAGLGLALGDTVTVNLLGREFTATLASLREVDWTSLAINFVMVFSPGLLEAAPQTQIATVRVPEDAELALQKAVTDRFANVSAIRVKDALDSVNRILGSVGVAVRATASVTLVAGVLVLAGAVVAGHRRRVYDAVVLKVLGATRRDVARAYLLEYGLLGLVTAAIAAAGGTLAGWVFLTQVMEGTWTFLPGAVAATAGLGAAVTLLIGLAGTWRALGQRPAPLLRND